MDSAHDDDDGRATVRRPDETGSDVAVGDSGGKCAIRPEAEVRNWRWADKTSGEVLQGGKRAQRR